MGDYCGARYYDAAIGRWLAVDPIPGNYEVESPYVYVLNNPLNNIDPNGLWTNPIKKPTYRGWYGRGKYRRWNPSASRFGADVRTNADGSKRAHQGVDLTANVGTETLAVENGKIVFAGKKVGFGKTVMLKFTTKKGKTKYAMYSHLSGTNVKKGNIVKEGQIIGKTGKSGNAKNLPDDQAHLHFGIAIKNPAGKGVSNYEDPENYMKIIVPEKPKHTKKEDNPGK